MNKGLVNILVAVLVIVIAGVAGYFVLVKKPATPIKTQQGECPLGQPDCVDFLTNGAPVDGGKTVSPSKVPPPIPSPEGID